MCCGTMRLKFDLEREVRGSDSRGHRSRLSYDAYGTPKNSENRGRGRQWTGAAGRSEPVQQRLRGHWLYTGGRDGDFVSREIR